MFALVLDVRIMTSYHQKQIKHTGLAFSRNFAVIGSISTRAADLFVLPRNSRIGLCIVNPWIKQEPVRVS